MRALLFSHADAPLMKNHLSMEASILSGGRFSLGGSGGSCSGATRLGECETVRFVLVKELAVPATYILMHEVSLRRDVARLRLAGDEALPGLSALTDDVHGVPVVTKMLARGSSCGVVVAAHFLFLHSPVKANWFSGLPSGIL